MTEHMNQELQAYIETAILPLYETFDPAHGPAHVRQVIESSLELLPAARELAAEVDVDMVYTVACYHDIGLRFGREGHGTASKKLLLADAKLRRWFSQEQIAVMGDAVEDHRASNHSEPRSVYGRIVSEADRDIDPERIARRCMEYGKSHYLGLTGEEQVERAVAHMENKYGEHGYLRLWMACPKNQRGLEKLRALLKSGEMGEICRRYL